MADPLTIATVGGLGLSAFGKLEESRIAAQNAELNALVREEEAAQVDVAVSSELEILDFEGKQLLGKQANAFAAAGIELTGSPALFLESQLGQLEKERQSIIQTGKFRKEALSREAFSLRSSVKDLKKAGTLGAVSGLLLGGATIATIDRGTPKRQPLNFGGS